MNWNDIKINMIETAEEVVGYRKGNKNKRPENKEVEALSAKQKELRLKISGCNDSEKSKRMKAERNNILHQIKQILLSEKERHLDEKVKEIDKEKDTTKMFKSVRELSRKKYENAYVHDENGTNVTNPQDIYKIINDHFQKQFFDETEEKLEQFVGNPRKLNNAITLEEVKKNIQKLNNNRAAGYDGITAEMVKYGPETLHQAITMSLNKCFEEHIDFNVGKGILAPINKPNKTKSPKEHLRAITLLPIIRKVPSNIVLERTNVKTEKYLSQSQSAYREFRSTSDIVWAYRWLTSRAEIYKEKIYITGIDMSRTFDTIKRKRNRYRKRKDKDIDIERKR